MLSKSSKFCLESLIIISHLIHPLCFFNQARQGASKFSCSLSGPDPRYKFRFIFQTNLVQWSLKKGKRERRWLPPLWQWGSRRWKEWSIPSLRRDQGTLELVKTSSLRGIYQGVFKLFNIVVLKRLIDIIRFVKWPKYIRLQRQKVVLQTRLKVPPAVNQFYSTLDRQTGCSTGSSS